MLSTNNKGSLLCSRRQNVLLITSKLTTACLRRFSGVFAASSSLPQSFHLPRKGAARRLLRRRDASNPFFSPSRHFSYASSRLFLISLEHACLFFASAIPISYLVPKLTRLQFCSPLSVYFSVKRVSLYHGQHRYLLPTKLVKDMACEAHNKATSDIPFSWLQRSSPPGQTAHQR
jgi:hypothetical protein